MAYEPKHQSDDRGRSHGLDGFKERRSRGTRRAMDWQYNFRLYLTVPLVWMFGAFGGVDLLSKDALWQQAAGLAVLIVTATATAILVRWLLRPVDEDSLRELRAYHESMRWRNIWKDSRRR